ncbi:hypothetical protein IFVP195_C170243 [Vibrio parahaemolyticus]
MFTNDFKARISSVEIRSGNFALFSIFSDSSKLFDLKFMIVGIHP